MEKRKGKQDFFQLLYLHWIYTYNGLRNYIRYVQIRAVISSYITDLQ